MKRFLYEHSFSITMGVLFVLDTAWFFTLEAGPLYDFANMFGGIFGGGFIIALVSRWTWEKDADPTKPPR